MSNAALFAPAPETPGSAARAALRSRFEALQSALEARVSDYAMLTGRAQTLAQHHLLLHLELPLKLQEQVLLPALQQAEPGWEPEVQELALELQLLRDAGLLLRSSSATCHELALSLLQGMARLHCARLQSLLRRPGAAAMDWPAARAESDALIARWHDEIAAGGDLADDEDADPVGAAPR
jgi:hypothetical protein